MSIFPIALLQRALRNLPKQPRQSDNDPIDIRNFYVPLAHAKALHSDVVLVEGAHGVGKSEWWLQLSNPEHLSFISSISPRSELENTICSIGFGQKYSSNYPGKQILSNLLKNKDAQTIWNTIIALAVLPSEGYASYSWEHKIEEYERHVESFASQLRDTDDDLFKQNKKHIILFDALDYTSDDRSDLNKLLKGLLQSALEFRSFKAIRLKIFVRPEILEDNSIYSFTGGSKIINNKLALEWKKPELFNLLWQYLGNDPEDGEAFRNGCEQQFNQTWKKHSSADVWQIPDEMRRNEALQREIFHALTGEWMGDSAKSGAPYSWLPNHLADGFGKVSPSSFLAALHEAATSDFISKDQPYPLNSQALKKGVQIASKMQVTTFNEKYSWIEILLKNKELSFPCDFDDISSLWSSHNIRSKLDALVDDSASPPRYSEPDFYYEGIKQDLIDLGIFQPMHDGRINMPDIYRIGYGLRRKGGLPAK